MNNNGYPWIEICTIHTQTQPNRVSDTHNLNTKSNGMIYNYLAHNELDKHLIFFKF